jgi:hypothetical protein
MPINELIAGGIKLPQFNLPDYGADLAQMAQIQNARNQNALAQYQLSAAQREDAATNALNAAYKDAYNTETGEIDLNKLRKSLSTGGFGSKLPALEKSISELKTQKLTQSKTETELIDSKLKQSRSFLDTVDPTDPTAPGQVIAWHEANHKDPVLGPLLASRGITAAQSRARIEQAIKQGPQAFAQLLAQSKLGIEKFMEQNAPKFFTQDVGGQTQLLSVPGLGGKSEVVPGSVMTKTLTPGESKESIRTVDTNDEVLTMAYDPVTGVDRIVSRQKKNLTPGESRPQLSTVSLGGTVQTRLFDPTTSTFTTVRTDAKTAAPAAPSPLAVMQAERDALPLDDPRRNELDKKIARETEATRHFVNSEQGVMSIDPVTNKVTPVLINGKPLIDSGTKRGREQLDIALQRLNLSRQTERRLQDEADSSGGLSPQALDIAAQMVMQSGVMPPLGSGKKASEARVQVMNRVAELQSNPDAATAAAGLISGKQDTVAASQSLKDFTSGVSSRRVTANNTAINHLETMNELADKLNNKDIRIVNAAGNAFEAATGQTAPTNFDAAKQLVAAEVIKAVVANGGGVKEREEAAQNFARANSPAQLKGVISTYKELLGGQLQSLEGQYKAGTKRDDFRTKFLTPNTQKVLPAEPAKPAARNSGGVDLSNPLLK